MAKAPRTVDAYMAGLEHPLKPVLIRLREIVLAADPGITEQVKWNAPSFCWNGDDRVTANLRPGAVLLVFHRGVAVKDAAGFSFDDPAGSLKWAAKDRGTVSFASLDEVESRAADLADLVRRWMHATA